MNCLRPGACLVLIALLAVAPTAGAATSTRWLDDTPRQDCSASAAQRLAPLEAAVARNPRRGRLDRAAFAAEWRSDGTSSGDPPFVIRLERGECDGETALVASPMDNIDRLEQRDVLVRLVGKALSAAHAVQARRLFEDAADVYVSSDDTGAVLTLWSRRRTRLFPHGAWMMLGPDEARLLWTERADHAIRAGMLELMKEDLERRGGRPRKWRTPATDPN
ncbi:MAG: hypothetical protein EPO46_02740 [Lysobacter sp.]|nr:MAG: hypothetical protein EPO46_02740 [Lysobacter sp.]